jgi:hypothetical protein
VWVSLYYIRLLQGHTCTPLSRKFWIDSRTHSWSIPGIWLNELLSTVWRVIFMIVLFAKVLKVLHTGRQECSTWRPVWSRLSRFMCSDGYQLLWKGSKGVCVCVCEKGSTSPVAPQPPSVKSLSLMMVVYMPRKYVGLKVDP